DGSMYLGVDVALELVEVAGLHVTGNRLAHHHHGIPRLPALDLIRRAITRTFVGSGADMSAETVSLDLDEMRALARAYLRQQTLNAPAQQLDVVAVQPLDRKAKGLRTFGELRDRLPAFDRRMRGILVVLTNDQHRQVMQGREVEDLVGDALVENAVTDHRY